MCFEMIQLQKGVRKRFVTYVGPTLTTICYNKLTITPQDKLEMGLTENPSKLSSKGDDSLSKSTKRGKGANSPEPNKLLFEKIPTQKVHVGVGTIKRYIPQVTISDDLMWESKGKDNPSLTLGCPWTRDSMSFGLDEAMKWVLEWGGVRKVVAKKDAFCDTLKQVQAWVLVSKK